MAEQKVGMKDGVLAERLGEMMVLQMVEMRAVESG